MTSSVLLLLLSTVAVSVAVSVSLPPDVVIVHRSAEDTAHDVISALSHSKFEEWSAAFISTNDKIRGGVIPATLFVPTPTVAAEEYNGDQRVAAYHVVPEKMEFSDLLAKKDKTRIRTLLGGFWIQLRNTSEGGLTLDGVNITEPDIFVDSFIAIHRIAIPLKPTSQSPPQKESPPETEWPLFAFALATLLICVLSCIFSPRR